MTIIRVDFRKGRAPRPPSPREERRAALERLMASIAEQEVISRQMGALLELLELQLRAQIGRQRRPPA